MLKSVQSEHRILFWLAVFKYEYKNNTQMLIDCKGWSHYCFLLEGVCSVHYFILFPLSLMSLCLIHIIIFLHYSSIIVFHSFSTNICLPCWFFSTINKRLRKLNWTIKNKQYRHTDNIRHRMKINKKHNRETERDEQHGPHLKTGGELRCLQKVSMHASYKIPATYQYLFFLFIITY
jgi:hypothetical protein